MRGRPFLLCTAVALCAATAQAQIPTPPDGEAGWRRPTPAGRTPPTRIATSQHGSTGATPTCTRPMSMDAGAFGAGSARRCLPLRARRGGHLLDRLQRQALAPARLPGGRRPLRQHGLLPDLLAGDPTCSPTRPGRTGTTGSRTAARRRRGRARDDRRSRRATFPERSTRPDRRLPRRLGADHRRRRAVQRPGRFTAFIGYEWTSTDKGNNLHRVVIYRDGGDKASQMEPVTTCRRWAARTPRPLEVDAGLRGQDRRRVLAIAHNGNLSQRHDVPASRPSTGKPLDREYVETRARWEPLYEATQIKGDGETHPFLSPDDEFADYETWDQGNLDLTEFKTDDMLPASTRARRSSSACSSSRSSARTPTSSA